MANPFSRKDLERKRQRRRQDNERSERKRWFSRPIWPAASLENNVRSEEFLKKLAKQCESTSIRLGWSKKRLDSFQKLFAQYQRSGSSATYLKIRRAFPEAELFIVRFYGLQFAPTFEDELARLGLDWRLMYRALDGADEPAVDSLCLRLMEMLVKRDALPKNGPGHIDRRRGAISDGFVNYIMVMLLEHYTNLEKPREIPGSLVVLMRHQLCGENPDLYEIHQADYKRILAAQTIADKLLAGEKLTVRKVAALLKISRMSAERLLASNKFQSDLDDERDALMRYDHIPEPWQPWQLPTRRRKADKKDVLHAPNLSHQKVRAGRSCSG